MYIPDPTELAEMRIERMIDELDVRDGKFNCPGCGKRSEIWDAQSSGPEPDAMPLCKNCCPY
jgi:hypothetical protein